MINRVVLVGRLTKEIDLRKTASNMSVTGFTVAVDNNRKDENGNKTTSFISCTAFGQRAEFLKNYARKGSLVGIEGRLQQRSFVDKNNQNRSVTEVMVDNVTLLEPKGNQSTSVDMESTQPIDTPAYAEEENIDVSTADSIEDDLPF